MELQGHASAAIPEWEIARSEGRELNKWQLRAEETDGWATRANAATLLGTTAGIGSAVALHFDKPVLAESFSMVDGMLDLVDGELAKRDGVRSPLGKKLDAGSDKLRMPLQIYTAWRFGAVPTGAALIMGATEVAIALPSAAAILDGTEPDVSSSGKIKSFTERIAAGGFLLANIFERLSNHTRNDRTTRTLKSASKGLHVASWALTGTTVVFGLDAAKQSAKAAGWLPATPAETSTR